MTRNNFSEVEMMILAELAYLDVPGMTYESTSIKIDLGEMLTSKTTKGILIEKFPANEKDVKGLIGKVGAGKYEITKAVNDRDNTGFAAIAITGPNENVVTIAARGTEGFSFDHDSRKDVKTDLQLGHATEANQQKKMNEFMIGMEKYDDIYLTGHSLGGNLVVSGAIGFLFPEKIKGVYSYNAPGLNSAFRLSNSDSIKVIKNKVINFQNEGDYVSDIMVPIGEVIVIESNIERNFFERVITNPIFKIINGGKEIVDNHSLGTFKTENGSFVKSKNGKNLLHQTVQVLSRKITDIICTYKFIYSKILPEFIPVVIKKVIHFVNYIFNTGYKYATDNPIIKVDTHKLRSYADRLEGVNRRLNSIDNRMNSLYWSVGFLDLFTLLQADLFTDESLRLKRCISYLDHTAIDFEKAERNIINRL